MFLDGKEAEGKIGDVGSYSVDINMKGKVKVELELDLVAAAKAMAAKTSTPLDDKAIEWLESIQKLAGG